MKVYSTVQTSQFPVRRWDFDRPHRLVLDKSGNIWVSRRRTADAPGAVICCSPKGDRSRWVDDVADPTALTVDADGHLLVADAVTHDVRIYDITDKPKSIQTFGQSIYSGKTPGLSGEKRFAGIVGIGVDSQRNIYIAQNGMGPRDNSDGNWAGLGLGATIESYSLQSGQRNWVVHGLGSASIPDFVPDGENDLYTLHHHLKLDLAKPAGKQWDNYASTCDPASYPHDARFGDNARRGMVYMRRLKGKLFMYTVDPIGGKLCIYRFPAGEVAAPSCAFVLDHYSEDHAILGRTGWPANQPAVGPWIWRDSDGNGRMDRGEYIQPDAKKASRIVADAQGSAFWPDSVGDIWLANGRSAIQHFHMLELDRYGNPTYSYIALEEIPPPQPFTQIERIQYLPETDTMWLAGYTAERPDPTGPWGRIGTIICRYDNWSRNRKPAIQIAIPNVNDLAPIALAVAGDYVFVQYLRRMECRIYSARDGAYKGLIEPKAALPDDQHDASGELRDHLRTLKRANGEYLLLVGDQRDGKTIMYRWKPAPSP